MKIIIMEDEKVFARDLADTIENWCVQNQTNLKTIEHYISGEDLFNKCKNILDYDIIFLDIKLESMSGIEVAELLRKRGYDNAIVFTSNNTDFEVVQKGYNVGAINYFSKPVTYENIDSCMKVLNVGRAHQYTYNGNMRSILYKDISVFEKTRNHIYIHKANENHESIKYKSSITELMTQLPVSFVQIHRSYVVNVVHITGIDCRRLFVKMDGAIIDLPISDPHLPNVLYAMRFL